MSDNDYSDDVLIKLAIMKLLAKEKPLKINVVNRDVAVVYIVPFNLLI